ncbi:hypothetical protein EJ04DRAFT_450542, partial [Polyplosphaeria fusca]
ILLPLHLTPDQKKLIYDKENIGRLEAEPIDITLGNVTLTLEHLDITKDIPNRWATVRAIINSSSTRQDWENVVRMMEGFKQAGVRLRPDWQEKIIRRLNLAGMQHLVLRAVQQSSRTGLQLKTGGLVHVVLRGQHMRAAGAEWSEEETRKALSAAEQIIELLENREHLGGTALTPGDLRSSPFVIAYPAELAAVRAKRHTKERDEDGKVLRYTSRLMDALTQDEFMSTTLQSELAALDLETSNAQGYWFRRVPFHVERQVWKFIPVLNALQTSRQVLGQKMPRAREAVKVIAEIKEGLAKASVGVSKLCKTLDTPHVARRVLQEIDSV